MACENNYHYLDDSKSLEKNHPKFIEHRHDQSILSLLCHIYKYPIIDNDFNFHKILFYKNSFILKYPIHAIRNVEKQSVLDSLLNYSEINKISNPINYLKYIMLNNYQSLKILVWNIINNISKWI